MDNVLVIQNAGSEGLGLFRQHLESDGYAIETIQAKQEKIPSKRYSFLIILGASESVNDNLGYLSAEMDLIQNYVNNGIPVLGVCLGSQLIAKSLGASVYHGAKKESGFLPTFNRVNLRITHIIAQILITHLYHDKCM